MTKENLTSENIYLRGELDRVNKELLISTDNTTHFKSMLQTESKRVLEMERELEYVKTQSEIEFEKNRRSSEVSAVLAAFFLRDRSELQAADDFIQLAVDMMMKVEDLWDPLRQAFRWGIDENHAKTFDDFRARVQEISLRK